MQALGAADVEQIWRLLKSVLAHNTQERQNAEQQLEALAAHAGFCACLLEVLKQPQVEDATKWLAVVQLKNVVSRRWAQARAREVSGSSILSDAEKDHVRGQLLHMVGARDNKIALQVAVIIAKVARHDYPAAWPSLFNTLTCPCTTAGSDPLVRRRAWLTLHHVLKELASKRLLADQRRFHGVAAGLLQIVWTAWAADAQAIAAGLPAALEGSGPKLDEHFEQWMLVTKVLRRLLMHGVTMCASRLLRAELMCAPYTVKHLPSTAASYITILLQGQADA